MIMSSSRAGCDLSFKSRNLDSKSIIQTKVPKETFTLEWKISNLSIICPFLGHQDSLPLQTLRTEQFQLGNIIQKPSLWHLEIDFDYTTTAGNKYVMIALFLDKKLDEDDTDLNLHNDQSQQETVNSSKTGDFVAKMVAQLLADDGEVLMHHKSDVQKFNLWTGPGGTGTGNVNGTAVSNKWQTFIPDHAFRSENMHEQIIVKDSMTLCLTIELFGPHMIAADQILIPGENDVEAGLLMSPSKMMSSAMLPASIYKKDWLRKLWSDKSYFDLEIQTDEKAFRVHKTVICAASPVFEAMLKHDLEEKKNNVIQIFGDFDADTVERMLKYLYCSLDVDEFTYGHRKNQNQGQGDAGDSNSDDGSEGENWAKLSDLIYIADKYQIQDLKEFAIVKISKLVNEDNVGFLIVLNDRMITPPYFEKVLLNFCAGRQLSLAQNKSFRMCIEKFPMAFVGFLFSGLNSNITKKANLKVQVLKETLI